MARKSEQRSQEWLDKNNTAEEAMSTVIFSNADGEIVSKGKNVVLLPEKTPQVGDIAEVGNVTVGIATGENFHGWGK